MIPDNLAAQPSAQSFAQPNQMNPPPPPPPPPPSTVPPTVPSTAPPSSMSNSTVVSPVIQIQGAPAVDSSQNQMMMQMMQMQMMLQMQNSQKQQNIIVNNSSSNVNTNNNNNSTNNTPGTECSYCNMLTSSYGRKVHGKCSLIWCISCTLLTGGLIFCVTDNIFQRCKDTEVLCAVCKRQKALLESEGCC